MLYLHGIDWASDDVLEALILNEGLERVTLFNRLKNFQSILNGLAKLKAERDVLIKLPTQSALHFHKHDNYFKYKLLTILQFIALLTVHLDCQALDELTREYFRKQLLFLNKLSQIVIN